MLIFDIETGPLDEDTVLAAAGDFVQPPHPGEFDPGSVKIGNLKDQAKIEAKIAEARASHETAVAQHAQTVEQARQAWVAEQIDRAPLSPITGRVLAIGYWSATRIVLWQAVLRRLRLRLRGLIVGTSSTWQELTTWSLSRLGRRMILRSARRISAPSLKRLRFAALRSAISSTALRSIASLSRELLLTLDISGRGLGE